MKTSLLMAALYLFPAQWPANDPQAKQYLFAALSVASKARQSFGFLNHTLQRTYFVTANHLARGVSNLPGALIFAQDGKRDLLLFTITQNTQFSRARFAVKTPRVGQCVQTFGSEAQVTKGKVLSIDGPKILHDAKIAVGHSGYPVFACESPDEIVGMNTWVEKGIAGAIRADEILEFSNLALANVPEDRWVDLRLWAGLF